MSPSPPAMLARTLQGEPEGGRVVAHLGSVEFMDATGLGALIKARSLWRARGGTSWSVTHRRGSAGCWRTST